MLGSRFHLLTVFGFRIEIDLSWFLIAVLIAWTLATGYFPSYYPHLSEVLYWGMGVMGMLGLFVCVLLHEMGHAFVARHYQLPIARITLFIFGGIAEIKKEPQSPKVEFLVAIAGPLVSIALAALFYGLIALGQFFAWSMELLAIFQYLAIINVLLVLFNMIPAFPLDGGRVFRSIVWGCTKSFKKATSISSAMGVGFGFFLIFLGILSLLHGRLITGIWLVVIGLFLQKAASSSKTQMYVTTGLGKEVVGTFMTSHPIVAPSCLSIRAFVDQYIYQSRHHLYPIVDEERFIGYCSLSEVKGVDALDWDRVTVKEILVPKERFTSVHSKTSALEALQLMQQQEMATLFVLDKDRLVGMVTAHDLCKLISLQVELEGGK